MLSVTLDHVLKLSKRFYSHKVIVIVKGVKKLNFLLVSKILQEKKYKEISTTREVLSTTLTIVTAVPPSSGSFYEKCDHFLSICSIILKKNYVSCYSLSLK